MIAGDAFSKIDPAAVSFTIASSEEYEYTIAALQEKFNL
jgi:hypothetical protein